MNPKPDAETHALARFAFEIQSRSNGMTREQALAEAMLWLRGAQSVIGRNRSRKALFTLEQAARLLGWEAFHREKWRLLLQYWREDNGQTACEEAVDRLLERHRLRGVTGDEVIYFRMLLTQKDHFRERS